MIYAILQHTPTWVWGVLAALAAYGYSQTRDRELSLTRMTVLPLVMIAMSFGGVISTFAHATIAIVAWAAGLALSVALGRRLLHPRGARWVEAGRTLFVPGSWLPFALMMGIFALKYGVGVTLGMHPALVGDTTFSTACGLAYGLCSGLFAARALSLRSVARPAGVAVPA